MRDLRYQLNKFHPRNSNKNLNIPKLISSRYLRNIGLNNILMMNLIHLIISNLYI